MNPREVASKEALADLLERGLSEILIAQTLRISERSVNRAMIRHGLREKNERPPLTDEQRARILVLAAEQMPVVWIAEDVGCTSHMVSRTIGPDPERNRIWKQEWQFIRRSERMLELNDEFRPKKDRYAA